MTCCHNPIFCLTPPHILTEIIHRGNDQKRNWALATLKAGERIRGHREALVQYGMAGNMPKGRRSKNGEKFRIVQTAGNRQNIKGEIVRREGSQNSGDEAVDEAYQFTGEVYDFFLDVFKRNSIDGKGEKLLSTVHFGKEFNNAFWNGERMVFGDGDGEVFDRFTKCVEIIGHEMTHGITNATAKLEYKDQPGALSESISDVFGCLVKQKSLNQRAKDADWVIGDGLFMPDIKGVGVRSIAEPGNAYSDRLLGRDPCPATMDGYVETSLDNGGIHINCTIPSHAFYLASLSLGGFAWEKLGRVWYNVSVKRLQSQSTFMEFAEMTMKSSNRLFGQGSAESKALNQAWKSVKLF